jgi:copper chaperone NosL
MPTRRQLLALLAAAPALTLVACGSDRDTAATSCSPILLTDEHECALCGMTVVRYPGPKGQACLRDGRVLPFCSVQDLLAWSWQPESVPAIRTLFVHDLSRTGWDEPADDAWVEAQSAVYVMGHDRQGTMGHSPAPFSDPADAEAFAAHHGGRVMRFEELNWDNLRGKLG